MVERLTRPGKAYLIGSGWTGRQTLCGLKRVLQGVVALSLGYVGLTGQAQAQTCFENTKYELQCSFGNASASEKIFALRSMTTHQNPYVAGAAWEQLTGFFQTEDQIQSNPTLAVEVLANDALGRGRFDDLYDAFDLMIKYGAPAPAFDNLNKSSNFHTLGTQYVRTIYQREGNVPAITLGIAIDKWAESSEFFGQVSSLSILTNLALDGDADLAYYYFQTAETETDRQRWQYYAAKHGHPLAQYELGSRLVDEDPELNPFWSEGGDHQSPMRLQPETGGELLKKASEAGVEGAREKYAGYLAKVVADQKKREEELARLAAEEAAREAARIAVWEAAKAERIAARANLQQGEASAMLDQVSHTDETRSFTKSIIRGEGLELTPSAIAFLGGVSGALIGRCAVPNKSELALIISSGASNMMFGADYSNPDIGKAISSLAQTNALMVIGQKVGKQVPCGQVAAKIAENISALYFARQTASNTFISTCPFGESKCGCLAQIASGVIPSIYSQSYDRNLIGTMIRRNPLLGFQVPMVCGIQNY